MSFPRAGLAPMAPALKPLLGALVLAFGALGAQAQSLTEVLQAARGVDATYLGTRSNADAAHYRYEQSRALHLPSANLQVQGGRQTSTQPTIIAVGAPTTADPDNVIEVPTAEKTSTNTVGATINASQTIYNRQDNLQIDQARKSEDLAQSQFAQADQDLIVRVAQAYFNVLTAADALQLAQGNSKAIAEQLASAKRNFEVGNATITDTREAEARADIAHSQQIAAENDLVVAKLTLDQLVGRTGVMPHPLVLPAVLPPVMPSQASDWVALAESDSPSLKQAQLNLEVAQLETSRRKAGNLPTLVAGASYNRNRQRDSFSPGGVSFAGTGGSTNVGLTLTVPLFTGFLIQNQVRESVALEEKARSDAEGAHNQVVLGTRTAFVNALTQAAQVKALEASEASSKLALDATLLGYKVGVKVNLDVLNAQSQLVATQRDASGARYNYLLAQLKLRQAAGNLTSNDLLPIDALLVR
jgi:outer membrane protein